MHRWHDTKAARMSYNEVIFIHFSIALCLTIKDFKCGTVKSCGAAFAQFSKGWFVAPEKPHDKPCLIWPWPRMTPADPQSWPEEIRQDQFRIFSWSWRVRGHGLLMLKDTKWQWITQENLTLGEYHKKQPRAAARPWTEWFRRRKPQLLDNCWGLPALHH